MRSRCEEKSIARVCSIKRYYNSLIDDHNLTPPRGWCWWLMYINAYNDALNNETMEILLFSAVINSYNFAQIKKLSDNFKDLGEIHRITRQKQGIKHW